MNYKILLGVAAGAGLLIFLRTEKGKAMLQSFVNSLEDMYAQGLSKGADKLKDVTHKVADTSNIPVEA